MTTTNDTKFRTKFDTVLKLLPLDYSSCGSQMGDTYNFQKISDALLSETGN